MMSFRIKAEAGGELGLEAGAKSERLRGLICGL